MRFTKLILVAGLAVAGMGGVAAADPGCDHDDDAAVDEGYATGYYDPGYVQYDPGYYQEGYSEPAAGTYANGYVWVAGAWTWSGDRQVWTPGHWQLVVPRYRYNYSYSAPVTGYGDRDHR